MIKRKQFYYPKKLNDQFMLKPKVAIGDTVLRRKTNGGEPDSWVQCKVNKTYLNLINEFPDDYRQLNGEPLEMVVYADNSKTAKRIVKKIGEYVNGLDRRHLGLPMMDEVAVAQMEYIVGQILDNPNGKVDMPQYD